MTTPTHIAVSLASFVLITKLGVVETNYIDLMTIFSAELIDLDHIFSKPIYHSKRNPFKTHFLHKKYLLILIIGLILLFFRPLMFLGLGLLLHIFLDYIYCKRKEV